MPKGIPGSGRSSLKTKSKRATATRAASNKTLRKTTTMRTGRAKAGTKRK